MTSSTRSARCSGGKGRVVAEVTSGCLHGAGERDPVGIYLGVFGAGVHQDADGLVDAEQPVDLLTDHVGLLERSTTSGPPRSRVSTSPIAVSIRHRSWYRSGKPSIGYRSASMSVVTRQNNSLSAPTPRGWSG